MLSCGCRRKGKNDNHLIRAMLKEAQLLGSNLGLTSLVASKLPYGVIMPGTGPKYINGGITIVPNTSNDPNPTFAPDNASLFRYSTPDAIWPGLAVQLFIQDHLENTPAYFTDITQGKLHDCWLVSAMSSLCRYPGVIPGAFSSVYPPGSVAPTSVSVTLYNPNPTSYYQTSEPGVQQTVSNDIAVYIATPNAVAFARSDEPGEYWPCLMEKSVAAAATRKRPTGEIETGYGALDTNRPAVGMSLLTPGLPALYDLTTNRPTGPQLFSAWDALMQTGISIGISWLANPDAPLTKSGAPAGYYGLFPDLSYYVVSLVSANEMQMALIRFPFATNGRCYYMTNTTQVGEWNGPWSDCSPQWATPLGQAMAAATGFSGPRKDGLFWMDINDVALYTESYDIFIPARADMRAVDLRPTPLKGCPATQVANSNFATTGSLTGYIGDTITVTCSKGYVGGGATTCGADGAFLNVPTCTKVV